MRSSIRVNRWAALAVASLLATGASAETSEWMEGYDALKFANSLHPLNKYVTDIECKDSGKLGLALHSALVRLTYEPNTDGVRWVVGGWTLLAPAKREWEGKGFTLHKYVSFNRPTGLTIYCAIFYK